MHWTVLPCSRFPKEKRSATRPMRTQARVGSGGRAFSCFAWLPLQAGGIQEIQDLFVVHVRLGDADGAGVNVLGNGSTLEECDRGGATLVPHAVGILEDEGFQ